MKSVRHILFAAALALGSLKAPAQNAFVPQQPGFVRGGFVAENPPTASSHASTIIESEGTLMSAWFGGTDEGARDVVIWLSRNEGKGWEKPAEVANGIHDKVRIQYPCWNPVLFRPKNGPLYLFYKEGPSPSEWWGMVKYSDDNGLTWSRSQRLPAGIYGPIRNKPIELVDGTILAGSSTENAGWRVHMERTKKPMSDQAWSRTDALNRALDWGAIQPTVLGWPDGIQILCRTKQRVVTESWSYDQGKTWTRMRATDLPNPNSAVDAVLLKDGRALLVYNHSTSDRSMLNIALSKGGKEWSAAMTIENTPGAEFSYPAVIQSEDGMVHITYTWKREKIKHVVIDPSRLTPRQIVAGEWPW